jgi:hypothetical protein
VWRVGPDRDTVAAIDDQERELPAELTIATDGAFWSPSAPLCTAAGSTAIC